MLSKNKIELQPAFVLHSRPWRETSLIIEVFTQDYGRIAVVAKGARRPYSTLRAALTAFQVLKITSSGKGELKILHKAELSSRPNLLKDHALLCGYYMNELILKMTARDDPQPNLFQIYAQSLERLKQSQSLSQVLRHFELQLLRALGYGINFSLIDGESRSLEADGYYTYLPEWGLKKLAAKEQNGLLQIQGQSLLDISQGIFERSETLRQSKELFRILIQHHLGGQALESRRVLLELQSL